MTQESALRPRTIEKLAGDVASSFAMLAGMKLDIFTPLKDGPLSADELARIAGVDSDKTAPLLQALVAVGLLTVDGGRFANTPEAAHFLVGGRPTYLGMRHHAYQRRWLSMLQVAESIRTGTPQGRVDYASMDENERDSFYRGVHSETLAAGRELAARQDFSRYHRLVDIGGGSGGLAIAMAEAWPHLSITIADRPATALVAERYVEEAGVADRVRVVTADAVKGPLTGSYDVATIRGVFPVLTPDLVQRLLRNVGRALDSGGAVYVIGWVLDDSRHSPIEYATFNLNFVNAYDRAQLYTEDEIRSWLVSAGFQDIERERSAGVYGADFMVARKPASPHR